MNKKILTLILLLSNSLSAFAASEQIPIDRKITKIRTYKNYAMVYISPRFYNTQDCGSSDSHTKLILNLENEANKEMYTIAMAAGISEKMIGLGINGCYNATGYPSIYRVDVQL